MINNVSIKAPVLNFVSWNIHDAHSRIEGNKVELPDFSSATSAAHFICLQETKRPVKISGYRCFNSNRPKSKSGGVCIAVKNELAHWISPIHCNHPDVIMLRTKHDLLGKETILVSAYDSPDASSYKKSGKGQDDSVTDTISDILADSNHEGSVILLGDFNARMGNKVSNEHLAMQSNLHLDPNNPLSQIDCPRLATLPERSCEDTKENSKGKMFLEFVRTNSLVIANGRTIGDILGAPTCVRPNGASMVDYCCTDIDLFERIHSFSVDKLYPISDHRPLRMTLKPIQPYMVAAQRRESNFTSAPAGFVWEASNNKSSTQFLMNQMERTVQIRLHELLQMPLHDKSNVQDLNNETTELLQKLAFSTLKQRKAKKKGKPWYDKQCSRTKRSLDNASAKVSDDCYNSLANDVYHSAKRSYRNLTRRKKNGYLWRLNKKISHHDTHQLNWSGLKRLKAESTNMINFDVEDLHIFYTFFKGLYDSKCDKSPDEHPTPETAPYIPEKSIADELSHPISMDELSGTIKDLKNGKSPSLDQVANEMLRSSSFDLKQLLLKLFNGCLTIGCYPWSTSLTTVIHKKGSTANPDNYRAITLGSCIGKLYSSILLNRLTVFRAKVCPDTPNQQGFAKGGQTNDHTLVLKTILEKYLKKKKQRVFACFVDYRKAFDSVCRIALLKKLDHMGVCGGFFASISDMYCNSRTSIKLSGMISQSFLVRIGTEQGHPLSPEFFKMFLDEMSQLLNSSKGLFPVLGGRDVNHLLWADDIVLLALDSGSMNSLLAILGDYATTWELEINTEKTKILVFNPSGRVLKDSHGFQLLGKSLDSVKEYTYLGIVFSASGSMKAAITNLSSKGSKAVFLLRKTVNGDALSAWSAFKLFDALITPIITYGCPIWLPYSESAKVLHCTASNGETYMKRITADPFEKVQLKFIKWVLGVHKKSTNTACYGETGRAPISITVLNQCLHYFARVMSRCGEDDSLLGLAAKEQKILQLDWYTFWNKLHSDTDPVRQTMEHQMVTHWESHRQNQSKMRFYNSIKSSYGFEDYLDIKRADRKEVSKIRVSAHDLRIETSRYSQSNQPKFCRFCCDDPNRRLLDHLPFSETILENEEHVITACPAYSHIRDTLPESLRSAIAEKDFSTVFSKHHCSHVNRFLKNCKLLRDSWVPD